MCPDPPLWWADDPVEHDRAVEATGGGSLERLHPTHAEPEDSDLTHVVVHDEVVGRDLEVAELDLVVEPRHVVLTGVVIVGCAHIGGPRTNGSGATTANPCVASRRHRSSNSGRMPIMSGNTTTPDPGMPSGRAWTVSTGTPSGPLIVTCSTSTSSPPSASSATAPPGLPTATRSARGSTSPPGG